MYKPFVWYEGVRGRLELEPDPPRAPDRGPTPPIAGKVACFSHCEKYPGRFETRAESSAR